MRVTMKQLAEESGVSTATVSYVLNNGPRMVSEDTRARVQSAMTRMNYSPSAIARGMTRKRMDTFGVVYTNYIDLSPTGYFTSVLHGILTCSMDHKQNIMLFTDKLQDDITQNINLWCDGRCDGLILIAPPHDNRIFDMLKKRHMKFVVIGDSSLPDDISYTDVDNVLAACEMTNYLLKMGHVNISILLGDAYISSTIQRLQGFKQSLSEAGIAFREEMAISGRYNETSGFEMIQQILRLPRHLQPTALFCCSDEIAQGALQALNQAEIPVPEEMSLVGFDDIITAALMQPALTTVRQPLEVLGKRAAEILLEQLQAETPHEVQEFLPAVIVERQSAAPPMKYSQRSRITDYISG